MTPAGTEAYAEALELGRLLAGAGAAVATGGYGGTMEAVCRGAVEAGGATIGYTVEGWTMRTVNAFLTEERRTADLYVRLRHLIEDADALVVLGGGIGTLVELALAWNLFYMRLIPQRPLVLVGERWRRTIDQVREHLEISDAHMDHVRFVENVGRCVELLRGEGVLQ